MRFGLVGTGFWAETCHAPALVAAPGVEFAGVWGRDPAKAAALGARFDVPAAGSFDELLAGVDANCSPLGWPGVKGHTVNYLFEDLIPDLRKAGLDEATITTIFEDQPADFLSIHN